MDKFIKVEMFNYPYKSALMRFGRVCAVLFLSGEVKSDSILLMLNLLILTLMLK